jgi:octaprenyl-diphosphate synthase
MFVFLTAKMISGGSINERTYRGASVIELIHTATLVHDDVVDDSNRRRGFFSLNALWKNKIAVLVGDYLLSKGLLLSIDHGDFDLLRIISVAVREMSEGELMQIEKARYLSITEETYFEVIRKKTASLIATCCEAGALSVNAYGERERMRKFGELVGLAFQIKDDIFDYGSPGNIGKPTGIDIREQKMTLPLIYAIRSAEKKVSHELMDIVRNHHEDNAKIRRAVELVIQNGGIEYAHERMIKLANEAIEMLAPLPDSDAKRSLIGLVNYTINREK